VEDWSEKFKRGIIEENKKSEKSFFERRINDGR
jgi:hypothetical protein